MTESELDSVCERMLSKIDDLDALEAASSLIISTNDRGLRSELIKLVTQYQSAKDSIQMNDAFEDLVKYNKQQYAAIVLQGFLLGVSYYKNVINKEIEKMQKIKDSVEQIKPQHTPTDETQNESSEVQSDEKG